VPRKKARRKKKATLARKAARDKPSPHPHANPNQGANLRYWRKDRGLSLRQLSAKCAISFGLIGQYERADVQLPYDSARKLAEVLEIQLSAIWDDRPPPA